MEENKCKWEKIAYGYKSGCGKLTKNSVRNFLFCPYCGKEFGYNREEYMHEYYLRKGYRKGRKKWTGSETKEAHTEF